MQKHIIFKKLFSKVTKQEAEGLCHHWHGRIKKERFRDGNTDLNWALIFSLSYLVINLFDWVLGQFSSLNMSLPPPPKQALELLAHAAIFGGRF